MLECFKLNLPISTLGGTNKWMTKLFFHSLKFIKEKNDFDVLYEIMLKYGVFNQPVEEIIINNKKIIFSGKWLFSSLSI